MEEPIEFSYFKWLCAEVIYSKRRPNTETYLTLLTTLQNTEFAWVMLGDDNRAADGIELRSEFLTESGLPASNNWMQLGCSVLEMLIAFSRRASFMTNTPTREWFWELIDNLGLMRFSDSSGATPVDISEALSPFIWRTYDSSGHNGGLFPLKDPKRDQRNVEIWYQFCDYLEDRHRMP